ncbi:MAG: LytR C-terminal domain-containing protein [Rhodoferax sp.]|nr:LytR C-terminal domain-containing protein [Actinomycetota bacterium]
MPALLVVLAVVGVGVGTWQLNHSTAASVAASGGAADGTNAGGDPTAAPTPTTTPTPTASPSPSPTPTPRQSGPADRTAPVSVLNGTRISGLAAKAATALRAVGWTVSVGNGRTTAPTSVVYATTDQQAAAQTLVSDLGDGVIEQSSQYGSRLTVLLGSDYSG